MRSVLFALALTLLLGGCASWFGGGDAVRQVRANLDMWRAFRAEGVVKVESGGLALHKDAIIRKNGDRIRLDVLESGLFATSGTFASIYVDTMLVMRMMGQTSASELDEHTRSLLLGDAGLDRLQRDYASIIATTREAALDSLVFTFDNHYRLSGVQREGKKGFVRISYAISGQPDVVELRSDKGDTVELTIDKFETGPVEVPALKP